MVVLALGVAALISGVLTWETLGMVAQNAARGEVTSGLVPVPLWIPQVGMALGVTLFTVAIVEDLINALRGAPLAFTRNEPVQGAAPTDEGSV
jgi:TRAP-type C4-dicarboxylate transport system permease small subunit